MRSSHIRSRAQDLSGRPLWCVMAWEHIREKRIMKGSQPGKAYAYIVRLIYQLFFNSRYLAVLPYPYAMGETTLTLAIRSHPMPLLTQVIMKNCTFFLF